MLNGGGKRSPQLLNIHKNCTRNKFFLHITKVYIENILYLCSGKCSLMLLNDSA